MATVNETLTDVVLVSDTCPQDYIEYLSETAILSDQVGSTAIQVLTDSVEIDDALIDTVITILSDTVIISETWTPSLNPALTVLSDSVEVSDTLNESIGESLSDAVEVDDTLTDSYASPVEVLSDTVEVDDTLTEFSGSVLSDTVEVSDTLTEFSVEYLSDSVEVDDTLGGFHTVLEALSDTVEISDTLTTLATIIETLADSVVVIDAESYTGTFHDYLSDTVEITDRIYSNNPSSLAWVVNTETGAPSYYRNYQFNALAFFKGMLFAAAPDGIYLLQGNDDNGTDIPFRLKTGFMDFGILEHKRIPNFYFGYTGGELEVDVEVYSEGDIYTYGLEARDAAAPRNNRVRPGKGLSDRYWRITINNVGGSDLQIQDITADVVPSNRRL